MSSGGSSWRSLASSVSSSVKNIARGAYEGGYDRVTARVANWRGTDPETWKQWRERRREESKGVEKLALFPGYAIRRSLPNVQRSNEPSEFQIELFVDGYATSLRPPEFATRSQKAFMRIAKGFAALPKLPEALAPGGSLLPDDDDDTLSISGESLDLSGMPPPPSKMTEDIESEYLKHRIDGGQGRDQSSRSTPSPPNARDTSRPSSTPEPSNDLPSLLNITPEQLARLHANLDSRLQPFWSSILSNRVVRISVFATCHEGNEKLSDEQIIDAAQHNKYGEKPEPLVIQDVVTSPQGHFTHKFNFSYEEICTHPSTLEIAFGNPFAEHHFVIQADLLPIEVDRPATPNSQRGSQQPGSPGEQNLARNAAALALRPSTPIGARVAAGNSISRQSSPYLRPPIVTTHLVIPITSSSIRLISDIDDTIKRTDVLFGVKTIFQNVFVKPLEDLVLPGMGEWYTSLYQRGVKFHYVSNGPFELLTVLREFIEVSTLPPGSIKLKYYGGKNVFHGLWQPAGDRKRLGVLEVLEHFHDSKFFLVGDSGEQDLELYATIASEMPDRILGVFIRDVSSDLLPGETEPDPLRLQNLQQGIRPSTPPTQRRNSTASMSAGYPSPNGSASSATPYRVRVRKSDSLPGPNSPSQPPSASRSSTMIPLRQNTDGLIHEEPESLIGPTTNATAPTSRSSTLDSQQPRNLPTRTYTTPPFPGSYFYSNSNLQNTNSSVSIQRENSMASSGGSQAPAPLVGVEKRREELRMRVMAARSIIPPHVAFRLFKHPSECVEAIEILDSMGV